MCKREETLANMKSTGRVKQRLPDAPVDTGKIEQIWQTTREGKRKLSGSQPSRLAIMLNTSAFSLSTRFECLANLAKSGHPDHASRRLLHEIADIRKELGVCREVGYYALCKIRESTAK